jgi:hypothetical protein
MRDFPNRRSPDSTVYSLCTVYCQQLFSQSVPLEIQNINKEFQCRDLPSPCMPLK